MLHQQHIPGLEKVRDAFHHIGDLAAQQQDQLIELVIVIVQFLGAAVFQMEQSEAFVEIAALAHLADIQHGGSLLPCFSRFIIPHILPFYNLNLTQNPENISAFFVEKAVEFTWDICYTVFGKRKRRQPP